MAHRTTYPLDTVKSSAQLITFALVGDGADDMTIPETGSEVLTCTRTDTGDFDLTFRHSYPELKSVVGIEVVGDTAGLQARFTAIDVAAKTASITVEVAGTATDPASTDKIYFNLLVRNSGANG